MKRNKKRLITALIIIVAVAAVLVFMKFFNGNLLYISRFRVRFVMNRYSNVSVLILVLGQVIW